MPSVERIQQELGSAKSLDDFFGKQGIFARLFADTVEQMLEAELTAHLGYLPNAPEGRNSGNTRNGKRTRKLRASSGDTTSAAPPHAERHPRAHAAEHRRGTPRAPARPPVFLRPLRHRNL